MLSWQGQTDKIESYANGWTEGVQTLIIIFKLADDFSCEETTFNGDKCMNGEEFKRSCGSASVGSVASIAYRKEFAKLTLRALVLPQKITLG